MNPPPSVSGPIPANQFARDIAQERARRIESVTRSMNLSLDAASKRKTKSFFPCLQPLVNYVRFKLGLSFQPASPLEKIEKTNLAIYNRFRNFERSIRIGVFAINPHHFSDIGDSTAKVKKLHRKFNSELDYSLAKLFAKELRKTRDEYPEIDFTEAVCMAYESIYMSVADRLKDLRSYPKGYIDTARGQFNAIAANLKPRIASRSEPPESAPALPSAPAPIDANVAAPIVDDKTKAYLTLEEYIHLASEQYGFCREAVSKYEENFRPTAGIGKWPANAIDAFNEVGVAAIEKFLADLPTDEVSGEDLRAGYLHAMRLGETAAVSAGISNEEFSEKGVQEFRELLRDIRNDIETELGKHDDVGIASLFRS